MTTMLCQYIDYSSHYHVMYIYTQTICIYSDNADMPQMMMLSDEDDQ